MLPLILAGSLAYGLPQMPTLPEIRRAPQITYVDRSGGVIGVRGGQAPPPVDLAGLPAYVPAAFVSIEDRRFYEHGGFDAMGIARALAADLMKGRTAQGASTITQQLVRNLFLTNDQTLERKTQELLLAVQMEQKYSKQQILALYLSRVYFGSGCYGIEAASRRFFNTSAAHLSIRQAAALAAILKSPAGYSPVEHPEKSAERTRLVLDAMVDSGAITAAQRERALAKPLKVYAADPVRPAQYFVDWADAQVRTAVGTPKQDIVVQTTLDMPMQSSAAGAAKSVLAQERAGLQTALVAVTGDGAVRAMVGGADYGSSPFNRAVQARRQAGSSWKAFVYLTAMEAGRTPDTQAVDEPVTIAGWSPRNHTDGFAGPVTLQQALAQSINTVAAKVADEVGAGQCGGDRPAAGDRHPDQHRPGHGARHLAGDSHRDGRRLWRVRQWRRAGGSLRRRDDPRRRRPRPLAPFRPRRRPGDPEPAARRDGPDAAGRGRRGHRPRGGHPPLRHRRQDRHHSGFQGRLVLRLDRGLLGLRPGWAATTPNLWPTSPAADPRRSCGGRSWSPPCRAPARRRSRPARRHPPCSPLRRPFRPPRPRWRRLRHPSQGS